MHGYLRTYVLVLVLGAHRHSIFEMPPPEQAITEKMSPQGGQFAVIHLYSLFVKTLSFLTLALHLWTFQMEWGLTL